MRLTYILFSALFILEYVFCSNLTMVYPEANNVFYTGNKVFIEWQNNTPEGRKPNLEDLNKKKVVPFGSTLSYVTIALAYGKSDDLYICHVMTDRATLNLGYYEWTIPHSIPTRNNYVVEVGTDAENIAFAGYITIINNSTKTTADINIS